jgi:predicted nucleotidyltransferase component of viral defense system
MRLERYLRAYSLETIIAEKFHAMVMLRRANSRMKDFYDVWRLPQLAEFNDDKLPRAVAATFARRKTEVLLQPPMR